MRRALLLLAAVAAPAVADPAFEPLFKTKTLAISVRVDTYERNGPYATIVIRNHFTETNKVDIRRAAVDLGDCRNGYGVLLLSALDGRNVIRTDFAVGADSVAEAVASFVCEFDRLSNEAGKR